MKVVIPGGTGQVGTILARALHDQGHEVVVLGRNPGDTPWPSARWDAATLGPWTHELEGAEAVINLAGRSVDCRYGKRNRQAILDSRVITTRLVGQAIARARRPPRVWLQASTATIYAHRYDAANDEQSGLLGGAGSAAPDAWRFSVEVAKAWEREVEKASTPATRKVLLRSAMTMSPDSGGVFATLLNLVRLGLGGTAGNGRQYVSWIHEADFVRAVYWLIDRDVAGPVNLASPHPLPNAEFMKVLREAWGAGFGLPAKEWMLAVGAFFLRTETELILKSRRVIPARLLDGGFDFRYPRWAEAARELCEKCRMGEGHGKAGMRQYAP